MVRSKLRLTKTAVAEEVLLVHVDNLSKSFKELDQTLQKKVSTF